MPEEFIATIEPINYWNDIGVWGSSACPELRRVGHCRNCEVYATSGRRLLDRPATPDYIDTWTAALAEEHVAAAAMTSPHLVFRIGQAWLALPAANLREITEPGAVRTVPHRPREIVRGLVNVRGELYPCVSLHALFGEEVPPASRTARFLVARGSGGDWVFPVDEVEGMHDVAQQDVQELPVTLAKADVVYTQGLFPLRQENRGHHRRRLAVRRAGAEDRVSNLGTFSMWELFRSEVETQMRAFTDGLLALENGGSAKEHLAATMRAAHSIKGAARIVHLDLAVTLAHAMEDCLVAAQEGTLSLTPEGIDVLLRSADVLAELGKLEEPAVPAWVESQHGTVADLLAQLGEVRAGNAPAAAPLAPRPAAPPPEPQPLAEPQAPAPAEPAAAGPARDRSLKVAAQTLNRLMGLAGESLVQSRWFEPFSKSLLGLKRRHKEIDDLLESLQPLAEKSPESAATLAAARQKVQETRQWAAEQQAQLDAFGLRSAGLSDRLYREVVRSRMRPFGDGVGDFPRLVRDVARQLGKQARLEIIGTTTEVDREILDRLEAPLNHAILNSLDHGIERPDERMAAGKPAVGTIRIEARHRAGLFLLTVSDDGRGVNIESLRAAVVAKGMTTAEMAAEFSEAELLQFLFLSGFSTAESVTDISGRGVGLDAVQDMAKSVGGVAGIASRPGQGVTIQLELPLTLSVIRMVVAEIGGETPDVSIIEAIF